MIFLSHTLLLNLEIWLDVISTKNNSLNCTFRECSATFLELIEQLSLKSLKKLNRCFVFLGQCRGQLSVFIQVDMVFCGREGWELTKSRNTPWLMLRCVLGMSAVHWAPVCSSSHFFLFSVCLYGRWSYSSALKQPARALFLCVMCMVCIVLCWVIPALAAFAGCPFEAWHCRRPAGLRTIWLSARAEVSGFH